ncbi:Fmu (Sun) domain-containing protein [Leptotrichia hongkongensis]|uniref:Fmu (Sun) domain-containing protein n=1 Tax=Leptotrichia hongkongensis TaxID=554406 RepID=A0A510L9S8_9FUSO|nr:16S rRNA (cytosine(967)-C(5))-methyltransferase RsmB [Leptotrichia hongkongensis]BBM59781.1 Fmu (Sun) domain-containing protein [Leptotrichia hongkongensis]
MVEKNRNNIKLDIVNLLDEIQNGKYSNIQLNYYFSKNNYTKKEKMFITNVINIVIKNLIYIDYLIGKSVRNVKKRKIKQLLRISVAQLFFMESDNVGVIFEAGEIAKILNAHQAGFVNATLQTILKNKEKFDEEIPKDNRESIVLSYPQWFVNKMKIDYPNDYLEMLKSYKKRSYLSVRFDKNKITSEKFQELLKNIKTDVLFSVGEVYYLSNANIFDTEIYKNGDVVIQDASSYLAVRNLGVEDGETVLDACSAPGGKSLAILQLFNPKKLISTDIHEHKVKLLNELKSKYGYSNFEVNLNDATQIENLDTMFDKILLDMPCSGLGVLRKKPEKIYDLTANDIKNLKKLQKKIFESAYKSLKNGGEIVYSTCTFSKNENTNNIQYFLEKYEDLEIMEVEIPENIDNIRDEFGGIYISYKNKYLDGFYIAKLRKK